MSDSILIRLRHHAKDERNTAFARSTMREAEGHIERLRNDLFDALDCKNGAGPTALSLVIEERDSLRADLAASQAECERLRHDIEQQLSELLPGPFYMDPPDGGDVPVMEQLRRMADDAARYRAACLSIDAARAGKGE